MSTYVDKMSLTVVNIGPPTPSITDMHFSPEEWATVHDHLLPGKIIPASQGIPRRPVLGWRL